MICDCIVVGLRDGRLAEKLQFDADLTLENAVTQARQSEAVEQQQSLLRGTSNHKPQVKPGLQGSSGAVMK